MISCRCSSQWKVDFAGKRFLHICCNWMIQSFVFRAVLLKRLGFSLVGCCFEVFWAEDLDCDRFAQLLSSAEFFVHLGIILICIHSCLWAHLRASKASFSHSVVDPQALSLWVCYSLIDLGLKEPWFDDHWLLFENSFYRVGRTCEFRWWSWRKGLVLNWYLTKADCCPLFCPMTFKNRKHA